MKILFLFISSILFVQTKAQRQDSLYDGASNFVYGFSRVEKGNHSFYIDKNNQPAFDTIIKIYQPIDSVESLNDGFENLTKDQKNLLVIVEKDQKKGLINNKGDWILKPIYDTLQIKWNTYLQLKIGNKMTYANTWGKKILPLKFEDAGIMDGNNFDVKLNGKWGVYSVSENKMVIPFDYQQFDYCGGCGINSDYVFAQKNNKWGIIDFKNNILIPFIYDHTHWRMRSDEWVTCFKKGDSSIVLNIPLKKEYAEPEYSDMEIINDLLKAKKNNKYGLINEAGRIVVNFIYDDISNPYDDFHSGPYLLATKNKKTGIIDSTGKIIVPFGNYDFIGVKNNYFVLHNEKKAGLADSLGKILLPIEYDAIDELNLFTKNHKEVNAFGLEKNDQYGLFLPENKKLVAPKYKEIKGLSMPKDEQENILLEGDNKNRKELFNSKGDKIFSGNFDYSYFLSDNLLQLDSNFLSGLYNIQQNRMVLPMSFIGIDVSKFDNGILILKKDLKNKMAEYGLYDTSGKALLPLTNKAIQQLDSLHYYMNSDNSNIEIWNRTTSKITALHYTQISSPNKSGLCIMSDSTGDFLYNFHTNTFIDSVAYHEVRALKNGYFQIIKAQKDNTLLYGYADSMGKIVVPIQYDYPMYSFDLNFTNTKLLPLSKYDKTGDKYLQGYADLHGNVLVPPIYKQVISESGGNGFLVNKENKFGILNVEGKVVLKAEYINIILDETPNINSNTVKFNFPLLCEKEDNTFHYFDASGKMLSITAKNAIGFFPPDYFGIGSY